MSAEFSNEIVPKHIAKARQQIKKAGADYSSRAEILRLLEPETDKQTLLAALSLLRQVELPDSLEKLKVLATHSDPDVRSKCFFNVSAVLKEQATAFYIACLNHPRFREKEAASDQLCRYGDETAIPAIVKRLKQIIKTRKNDAPCLPNGETELTRCLEFLHPFRDRQDVKTAFQQLIEKWEVLGKREVWWIVDQLSFFQQECLQRPDHRMPAVCKMTDGNHPVFTACANENIEKLEAILKSGVSVHSTEDLSSRSLVQIAITNGRLDILKLLVAYGLDIERPYWGFNDVPFILALEKHQDEIVDYILDQRIDLNRQDEYGMTVFMKACCGHATPAQLRKMIELGANVHDRRHRGQTPFIIAARAEALETMTVLIENGAKIDEADKRGKTALIHSAQGGKTKSVQWLINHGADLIHCEHGDLDALYWARQNKHDEVVALIQRSLDWI